MDVSKKVFTVIIGCLITGGDSDDTGDEILEVNGVSLQGYTQRKATELFKVASVHMLLLSALILITWLLVFAVEFEEGCCSASSSEPTGRAT